MRLKILLTLIITLSFMFAGISPVCSDAFAKSDKKTTKSKKKKKKITKKSSSKKKTVKRRKYRPKRKKRKVRAAQKKKKTAEEQAIVTSMGGKTRIDFADLLIEGQTKKADTVYLFERTESKLESLVKIRKDFRKEIMDSYLE